MIIYDINHVLLVFGLGVILSSILWIITIHDGKSCKPARTKGTHFTMFLDTAHMGYFFPEKEGFLVFILFSKWVFTQVASGLCLLIPLVTRDSSFTLIRITDSLPSGNLT